MSSGVSTNRFRHLVETMLVTGGICIFGLFIHGGPFQRAIAFIALSTAAVAISLSITDVQSLLKDLGLSESSKKIGVYSLAGLGLGMLFALCCRSISSGTLLPQTLTVIAAIAPIVGITEELLFRGFLQGKLSSVNIYMAIVLSTLGHTLYKYLVLRSLPLDLGIDFLSLVVFTFIGGLICGVLRILSKSIIPACVTHGIFDVLVYGSLSAWPIWVWN